MTTIINGSSPSITFSDGSAQTSATRPFLNRLINGGMTIDQRNAGASVTINATSNTYVMDRWRCRGETSDGVYTCQQVSEAPVGFKNSAKITVTTADASVDATKIYGFQQLIEGFNFADLDWGTASAKPITISFWVRSSLTGTFGGGLTNGASNRSYPFTYTISVANTWEQKSITIAGDTSGTWASTNTTALRLNYNIGAGSDNIGTAGAWNSDNDFSATGAIDIINTLSATWQITGVQLEVGSTATSFDYRPYGTELVLCQRYFEKSYQQGVALGASGQGNTGQTFFVGTGNTLAGSDKIPNTTFMVTKRTAPTINTWSTNGTANTLANMNGTDLATNSCTPNVANDRSFFAYNATSNVSGTNGCVQFQWAASAEL